MILDNSLMFTGQSNGTTGGISQPGNVDKPTTGTQDATNIVDLGVISGVPPSASGGGARDIGVGDDPMLKLLVVCTTAFTGGTSIQAQLSGAPDNGSGTPGSYTIMWTGPTILEANATQGAYLANVDVPRQIPGQPMPRFLKLTFISAGTHGAGTVEGTIVIDRWDQPWGTTGLPSGYPPGVTVAN